MRESLTENRKQKLLHWFTLERGGYSDFYLLLEKQKLGGLRLNCSVLNHSHGSSQVPINRVQWGSFTPESCLFPLHVQSSFSIGLDASTSMADLNACGEGVRKWSTIQKRVKFLPFQAGLNNSASVVRHIFTLWFFDLIKSWHLQPNNSHNLSWSVGCHYRVIWRLFWRFFEQLSFITL